MNSLKQSTPETRGGWNITSNARQGESIIHLGGVKERRKREEHVLGAQHVPVIDMRVTLLRSTEDIIKSLTPPEDRD